MRALWLRRVGFSLSLALALGYFPYRIYRNSGLYRYVELRAELQELEASNDRLRVDARRLRAELETFGPADLTSDPRASRDKRQLPASVVERAARDELGLVKPGEIVFQFTGER
jgi:cell division protein FtsB